MNRLLCFQEEDRLDWPSIGQQAYLTTASTDYIPLKRVDFVSSDKLKNRPAHHFSDSLGSYGGDEQHSDEIPDDQANSGIRQKRPNSFLSS